MTAPPEVQTDDADVVQRSLSEPDAFTEIYHRYFAAIHGYIAGRLGPQPADDLAAEVFLAAFRKSSTFDRAKGSVRPWLFGFATNLIAQHRRAEMRRYKALARAGAGPSSQESHENAVVSSVSAERMQLALARALASLSAKERDVVLLMALGELTHTEIAEALGVPYGTVGSRLSTARRKLRAVLPKEES